MFLSALAGRALLSLFFLPPPQPDEGSWLASAADLAAGKGFTNYFRHPGYTAFLAGFLKLFGQDNLITVRLGQSLLSAAQIPLLFYISLRMFRNEAAAAITAAMAAFYPYYIYMPSALLSETLNSFLLTLSLAFLCALPDEKKQNLRAAAAGIALGLTALVKSTILAASPFIAVFFMANRIKPAAAALCLACAAAVILPWSARNYSAYGVFVPVNLSGWALFSAFNKETLETELNTRQLKEVDWNPPEFREIAKMPPAAADAEFKNRAAEFIRKNPGTAIRLIKIRFLHFWRLTPITESRLQKAAAMMSSGIIIPLSMIGLWLSRNRFRIVFLPWGILLAYNMAHSVFISTLRYRIPLDQFFILFAAFAAAELIRIMSADARGAHKPPLKASPEDAEKLQY